MAHEGHDHGNETPAAGPTSLEVELTLKVLDPSGKPASGLNDQVRLNLTHEGKVILDKPSHGEEEPGVYHVDASLEAEGEYEAAWSLPGADRALTASFPVVVGHAESKEASSSPLWLYGIGGVGLLVAFFFGRSTARGRSVGAAMLALLLIPGMPPIAQAGEGHDHSHDAGPASAEPLGIGIGKVGVMSQTREIEGYTLVFTLVVLPPDPSLVKLTEAQRELLGLEVETLGRAAFGKGISATGEVQADPSRVAALSAPAAGRVEAVHANLGQPVRKGQVLAVIHAPEAAGAQAEVALAQAALLQAQANRQRASKSVELAKQQLQRQQEFAQTGAFSQPTLLAARNELASAEGELAEAQSGLRQAKAEQATHARELARVQSLYADKLASRREVEAAELEARLDQERVSQSETRVRQTEVRVKTAREVVQREERIQREGLYNRREIENAKAEVSRAEGELRASETEVRGAQSTLSAARARIGAYGASGGRISIVSPIDGTIVSRTVNTGEAAEAGRMLFEVLDTRTMWVQVELFEPDVERVAVGMPVEIRTETDSSRVLQGTIGSIGKVVNPQTRTAPVRIEVSNPDGTLRKNEFAQALILTDLEGESLSVPASAIQEIGGLKVVFVQTPQGFRRTHVRLGPSASNRVEILEGLKPGDRVVTQGAYQLRMMAVAQ